MIEQNQLIYSNKLHFIQFSAYHAKVRYCRIYGCARTRDFEIMLFQF